MCCQRDSKNQSTLFNKHENGTNTNQFRLLFHRDLEITSNITGSAPEPSLDIAVRQGNVRVSGDLNVSPGTNLQMEIFLDDKSAPIYGLGVNYMQVTDTLSQEETIIYNGYVDIFSNLFDDI